MSQGTMLQYFHWYLPNNGSLWKQIQSEAPRLREIGFTSIWFPPAYKGANGGYSEGYNPYDLYDLGEFDQKGSIRTKYGTRPEYLEAIDAVHAAGMQVIVDIGRIVGDPDFPKIIQKIINRQADVAKAIIGKQRFWMTGAAVGLE